MSTIQGVVMEDRQRNRRKKTQSLILQQQQHGAERGAQMNLSASGTTQVPLAVNQLETTATAVASAGGDMFEPHNSGFATHTPTSPHSVSVLHSI